MQHSSQHVVTDADEDIAAGIRPSYVELLRIWFSIGLQSFGGGAATLYLIRRAVVEQRAWISQEEFARDWSLCFLAPGINLVCLTVLIGRRLGGSLGIALSLAGLFAPSVAITVVLTAVYASIRDLRIVDAALQGIIPATVGLGMLVSSQLARPHLSASKQEGWGSLIWSLALLAGSGMAAIWDLPVLAILIGAGLAGALGYTVGRAAAMIDWLTYFWLLLKASLFSTGGSGNLPVLYDELLARGWATDRQFAESLAIGQISPGPSGFWVISLGYLTYGLPGALLATVAILIPPLLVLGVDQLHRRIGDHPLVHGFVRGLTLAVVGVFFVVLYNLLRGTGFDPRALGLVVASAAIAQTHSVPVVALLALAGVAGMLIF
jgi:chromate transporter